MDTKIAGLNVLSQAKQGRLGTIANWQQKIESIATDKEVADRFFQSCASTARRAKGGNEEEAKVVRRMSALAHRACYMASKVQSWDLFLSSGMANSFFAHVNTQ